MPPSDPARRFHWSVYGEIGFALFSFFYAVGSVAVGRYGWAAVFVGLCAMALLAAWDLDRRSRHDR